MAPPDASEPARPRRRTRGLGLRWLVGAAIATATLGGVALALVTGSRPQNAWRDDPFSRVVIVVQFASTAAALFAGAWLTWRRPANRCGPMAMFLGVVFGSWWALSFGFPQSNLWLLVSLALVFALRPVLFWLVLAFPIGRLDRVSRRWLVLITIASATSFVISALTVSSDPNWPKTVGIWNESTFTKLVHSAWWDVGALFAAAAVLVIVYRRGLRFRTLGDRVGATALLAAVIATGADFVLIGSGPLRDLQFHADHLTPFGMGIQLLDLGRWGAVVVLLALSTRRAWPRETPRGDAIELERSGVDDSLRVALSRALGDPNADVAVRDAASGWLDLAGHSRADPGIDRPATIIVHGGDAVAALEYDDTLSAHPAVIDAAVAALALQLESARQLALARNRELELRQLGAEVLDAEDAARRRLERDLHDGAQQALVGVTLQAALAARNGAGAPGPMAGQLADVIHEVAEMLQTLATGRPPALLAERGLTGALGALVVTAGLPVTVDVDRCEDLPDALQRAIWFTAAEAVTNALKHAQAAHLYVTLRRVTDSVTLTVTDDGSGGVVRAPASLRRRVDDASGQLDIDSTPAGTVVRAAFPLGSVVAT